MSEDLKKLQAEKIAILQAELKEFEANGNEYYAAEIRRDLQVASSPARLIHKHK